MSATFHWPLFTGSGYSLLILYRKTKSLGGFLCLSSNRSLQPEQRFTILKIFTYVGGLLAIFLCSTSFSMILLSDFLRSSFITCISFFFWCRLMILVLVFPVFASIFPVREYLLLDNLCWWRHLSFTIIRTIIIKVIINCVDLFIPNCRLLLMVS